MKLNFQLLLFLCMIAVAVQAQNAPSPLLNIGDPAPPLRVREWIKGSPIKKFKRGKVYVVEFWATWCTPCIKSMPHLSALAREYKKKVTFLGINVYENIYRKKNPISAKQVKAFVDSMGHRMDYIVGMQDSNFMETKWLEASGEEGIPSSFIVDTEGKLVWTGHPRAGLAEVLPKVLNKTWDIKADLAKRNLNRYLRALDDSLNYELMNYKANPYKLGDKSKPDSALIMIDQIIKSEPRLKYAPHIASNTFSALLETDPHKAYEYGKEVLMTPSYEDPAYNIIIWAIDYYSNNLNLPAEIYELGTEAYQMKINQIAPEEVVNWAPKFYTRQAAWHWCAGAKSKAIDVQQKAIEILKSKKGFSATDLIVYEYQLKQYKEM